MENKKILLTEEEMSQIKQLQAKYSELTGRLGQSHLRKRLVEQELESIENDIVNTHNTYSATQATEKKLVDAMSNKYGNGTVDLDSGTFIPQNQEKTS